jgi:predicted transcriptional regulator
VSDVVDRLKQAVAQLEAAAAASAQSAAHDTSRIQAMQKEAESLRTLQTTVAARLDAAIERLKSEIGD